ncbi:TonB family protein [Luteimonas sp. S4-F44]|uniref:energy transducer TonB n=1 Tax=Luteimonas sp. S4-F44 TaxID=2925842 RepID=UPI001F53AFA0|nr:energy transducer TonB [Luteimonas sp. S4-F44]UNK41529.1 TonB family protein [Luteimonas sp. S4-F44]
MVLQQTAPRMRGFANPDRRPDPVRIVGIAGTLAFNAVVLSVLLVPAGGSDRLSLPDASPQLEFRWLTPPPPVPPRPPEIGEIVAPRSLPQAVATPTPVAPTIDSAAVAVPTPGPVTAPAFGDEVAVAPPALTAPMSGAQLQYAAAPPPPYPRASLRAGHTGVVQLEVHVGIDGRPLSVRVHRSSGYRDLDQAALRQVQRHWTFQPAMRDGRPIEAIGVVPIAFDLDRG